MNRRDLFKGFALGAGALLVPEPMRAYSFVGGWDRRFRINGPHYYDAYGDTITIERVGDGGKTLKLDMQDVVANGLPIGGAILFSQNGSLKFRSTSGELFTIA